MANFVIKRDGTRIAFDPEKIKVGLVGAAQEAGLSADAANDLAMEVMSSVDSAFEGKEDVPTQEIRDKIISGLDDSQPSVADAWRKYEEGKGV